MQKHISSRTKPVLTSKEMEVMAKSFEVPDHCLAMDQEKHERVARSVKIPHILNLYFHSQ